MRTDELSSGSNEFQGANSSRAILGRKRALWITASFWGSSPSVRGARCEGLDPVFVYEVDVADEFTEWVSRCLGFGGVS